MVNDPPQSPGPVAPLGDAAFLPPPSGQAVDLPAPPQALVPTGFPVGLAIPAAAPSPPPYAPAPYAPAPFAPAHRPRPSQEYGQEQYGPPPAEQYPPPPVGSTPPPIPAPPWAPPGWGPSTGPHPGQAPGQTGWGQPGPPQQGWGQPTNPQQGWGQQGWGQQGWGQPPVPPRRSRAVVLLASAIAVLLVGGLAAIAFRDQVPKWDPRVKPIADFVAQTRGLSFKRAVPVEFLPDAEFNKLFAAPASPTQADRDDARRVIEELRAFGLAEGDIDLIKSESQLRQNTVIGLYRPGVKRVFVRGDQLTPAVRVTLAHELTHALQDQHFNLNAIRNQGEAEVAFRSLVEADAVRTETAYRSQLSQAEQDEYFKESNRGSAGADLGGIPEALVNSQAFPYVFGPVFLEAILAKGGGSTSAIDAAMHMPPSTEAEVYDPIRYLSGQATRDPTSPALGSGEKREGLPKSQGAVSLFEMLADRIGFQPARDAIAGWRGDSEVLFRRESTLCARVATETANDKAAATLEAAEQAWALASHTATPTVERGDTVVTLTTCDPGISVTRTHPSPSPVAVLQLRASLQFNALHAGKLDLSQATCVADGVVAALPPAQLAEVLTGDGSNDALRAQIRSLIKSNGDRCRTAPA